MRIAHVAGAQFEFDFRGAGRPVLLLHGPVLADAMLPLLQQPELTDEFLLIQCRRRGYGASTRPSIPLSIGQHAADAAALLRHFGLPKAHVVGYCSGAAVALQMTLDFPDQVGAVALLEPLLLNLVASGPAFRRQMRHLAGLYERGDKVLAVEAWLQAVFGPEDRKAVDLALGPAALTRAVADAEMFFSHELPALDLWHFSQTLSLRLTCPILSMIGAETAPVFAESHELLMHWYPNAEEFELPDATHAAPMSRPKMVGAALASFLVRHPMQVSHGSIAQGQRRP